MKNRKLIIAIIVIAFLCVSLILLVAYPANQKNQGTISDPDSLPGIQITDAPWSTALDSLKARLTAINLPALATEGTILHIHKHIDIFVHGKSVAVPADIGVNDAAGFISPIHTHDDTAIIHVESPVVQTFTLGQFFDIWGVRLTENCIGGYCTNGKDKLKVFANGSLYSGDPRQLKLESGEEIVVTYGTDEELPKPVPSSYNFPAGY